ncbi:hypothetical protein Vi05172_g1380 [Venturia inaequalis]|uniref:Tautomerase n=1 Tax=Venturia inaequalis TaxID=5025 RepID=A0A8H3VTV7_VENIN|nr:hypothetical protein EG327_004956 [Venturia inaequalis]RDI88652.1 hypothetical protein Vi05172_g1380 [Venturia inaequalis]
MPLVKIDMIRGARTSEQIKKLADTVQTTLEQHFNAPYRDRYQIITQHEPYEMFNPSSQLTIPYNRICLDTGLDYQRTDQLVFIQIFQQGRDKDTKQKFYRELAKALESECDVPGAQLIISCAENGKEDWSFGEGRAQFLDGGLPVKEQGKEWSGI